MLFNALAENAPRFTLIALWDGEESDGPGGTQDLLEKAEERGHRTVVLDAKRLHGCT